MPIEWEDDFDLSGADGRVHEVVPRALAAGMGEIKALSTMRVPLETGNLQGAANITVHGNVATISYPGPYARYQEFGIFYRHGVFGAPLTHKNGRQAFYLTTSLADGAEAAKQTTADVLGGAI